MWTPPPREPRRLRILEADAVGVEGAELVKCECGLGVGGAGCRGGAGVGKECRDGLAVAHQRGGEGLAAGSGLGQAVQDGAGGDALARRRRERSCDPGIEVGPLGVAGPEPDRSGDADRAEPEGEVLAEPVGMVTVGSEGDEPDRRAGLGVPRVDIAN